MPTLNPLKSLSFPEFIPPDTPVFDAGSSTVPTASTPNTVDKNEISITFQSKGPVRLVVIDPDKFLNASIATTNVVTRTWR